MHPHRALIIPDVLHEILKHLSPYPELSFSDACLGSFEYPLFENEDRKYLMLTLARVARTCKAFSEPASRILWAVQVGLSPIVPVLKHRVSEHLVCDRSEIVTKRASEHSASRRHTFH